MTRGNQLLATFLAVLTAHGLDAQTLDPWRGWLAFKEYARATAEEPDPGISVQVTTDATHVTHLYLLRQSTDPSTNDADPAGGVIFDFSFALQAAPPEREYWSLDYATFERFVDLVEQDPIVASLFATAPNDSSAYWEEA